MLYPTKYIFFTVAHCPVLNSDPKQGLEIHLGDDYEMVPFLQNVSVNCEETGRPLRNTATASFRQCVYSPQAGRQDYWLAGNQPQCPSKKLSFMFIVF